ncbi:MAG: class I SAM-dependent methyltransferase [candidate division Zixibacteria bacterium]|nr:class I SAM-dependent methyltransferase [candidate division Zixibacteria bacterium]
MDTRDLIDEMTAYYDRRVPWHDEYMSFRSDAEMEILLGPIISLFEQNIRGKEVMEIACGTGNWTQVLAKRARLVVATDVNSSAIAAAKRKPLASGNVVFEVADAYSLESMNRVFDVVFAADWWSHVPRSALPKFLGGVHCLLRAGGQAIFLDMMMKEGFAQEKAYFDDEGNRVSIRALPDGGRFHVIKNFPTEGELREALSPFADDIFYYEHDGLRRWLLTGTHK